MASGPRCHLGQRQGPPRFVCTFCVTYPILSSVTASSVCKVSIHYPVRHEGPPRFLYKLSVHYPFLSSNTSSSLYKLGLYNPLSYVDIKDLLGQCARFPSAVPVCLQRSPRSVFKVSKNYLICCQGLPEVSKCFIFCVPGGFQFYVQGLNPLSNVSSRT